MLSVHPLFANDAVVQAEMPLWVGGRAVPGAMLTVQFAGERATTAADGEGCWSVVLPALTPGGPHELLITASQDVLRRTGLMVGELWLCSGQSNMEWTLGQLPSAETEAASASAMDAGIRCFTVNRRPSDEPAETLSGEWRVASPKTVRNFSAVAYFFASRLREKTGRAVGVIVSAMGGTEISAWLPREVIGSRPEYASLARTQARPLSAEAFTPHPYQPRTPESRGWEMPAAKTDDWSSRTVPGYWQDQGWGHNGAVWYRREIELPPAWRGRDLVLELGGCDDFDKTYVNGEYVGETGPETVNAYALPRRYPISGRLTARSTLTIAIRVFDHWGNGGITGGAWLRCAETPEPLDLSGTWRARVEHALPWRRAVSPVPASLLYNGMIAPLAPVPLRGVLWYQGESDVARAALYRTLLPDLIAAWRRRWNNPSLPFAIVQLASFGPAGAQPVEGPWAELRDAQRLAAKSLEHVGLVVAIDVGDPINLHPPVKRPVGERLARWALSVVYGSDDTPWASPRAIDHACENGALWIRFDQVGEGLRFRASGRTGFQIAGADRVWHWAEAEIIAPDRVRVHTAEVSHAVAVRYAWQDNPVAPLENSEGLPVAPFRTDDWPLTTDDRVLS